MAGSRQLVAGCYGLWATGYRLLATVFFTFYLLLFSFPSVAQWRVGFEAGVAVPMGATGLRSCFAADLKGEWRVGSDECGVMSDEELGIRNEELGRSRSLEVSTPEGVANTAEIERKRRINKVSKSRSLENGFRLKISVGHLRTLETLGPDYEAVPTDTASYQRRFIVYPVTVGGGYEWTVWSDEWRVGVSAEVGVALCYEKWRRVLSMTATDVWLEDIGLTGWVPAARVDAEVRLWDHVGVGVGVRWIGGGIWSDECGVMSDELGIRNEELGIRNSSFIIHHSTLKNRLEITEHVDRKRGELGGFGGAMWSVELRYWF